MKNQNVSLAVQIVVCVLWPFVINVVKDIN